MLIVIGDVHGKIDSYNAIIESAEKDGHSTLQIGDMGFNYDKIIQSPRHMFFKGNHDNYDMAHFNDLGDYGVVPGFDDTFFIRGAHSIDRHHRLAGRDWWPNEEISVKDWPLICDLYSDIKPEYVFSHDCPYMLLSQILTLYQRPFETATGTLLDKLFKIHAPRLWVFGHHHKTVSFQIVSHDIDSGFRVSTHFQCLAELDTVTLDI